MTVKPSRMKKAKFVKALAEGMTQQEAARSIGYSQASCATAGSLLVRDPEVKAGLEKLQAKYNLGAERAMSEMDRGLRKGKIGSHDSYLDKLLKLHGLGKEREATPTMFIDKAVFEAGQRGVGL